LPPPFVRDGAFSIETVRQDDHQDVTVVVGDVTVPSERRIHLRLVGLVHQEDPEAAAELG
jgi:desulfoferrodoxin (superoxide reductase-like protein)